MVLVSYLDRRDRTDISSGKLSFIDHTDIVTEHNSVFTFQSCLRNVKSINFTVAGNGKTASVKILQRTGKFVHIDTIFRGRILTFLIFGNRS